MQTCGCSILAESLSNFAKRLYRDHLAGTHTFDDKSICPLCQEANETTLNPFISVCKPDSR